VYEIEKDNPTILKYKTTYNETFKNINVRQKKRTSIDFYIPELRTLSLSGTISDAKKNDLLSLCHCNAIPKSHWSFYTNLNSASINSDKHSENNFSD